MCGTQLDLVMALMDMRVDEARRIAAAHRTVIPSGRRLERRAGVLLAQVGTWLVSLGKKLTPTTRVQPSI